MAETELAAGLTSLCCGESGSSALLLVVDDDDLVREVCGEMLAAMGYKTIFAADGLEALDLFRRHADRIALVFMDLSMPRMDGLTALKELRRIDPTIPVVLASGYSEQEATERFAGQGLMGFIQKPFRIEALCRVLQGVQGKAGVN